jgi:aromatic-L-amino-acid decarboxylase
VKGKDELNRLNEGFLDEINGGGELFLTHTKINGLYTLRMITGQTYVEEQDVDRAVELIRSTATETLRRKNVQ